MAMGDIKEEQQPEILDEATVEAVELGLNSEETGHYLTMDQAVRFAKNRREAWQTVETVHVATV